MPLVGKQKFKNCPELGPLIFFSSYQFAATVGDIEDILATHYIFSYGTGSPIPMSTNSTPHTCTSSSCQHTFRAPSHHVQQYTVSVAARNVIGVGNASTPVTVGMWCYSMNEESIELVLYTVNFTSWSALMKLHVLCTLVTISHANRPVIVGMWWNVNVHFHVR